MIYCVRTERQNTEKYVESISRSLPNSKLVSYKEAINSTNAEKELKNAEEMAAKIAAKIAETY